MNDLFLEMSSLLENEIHLVKAEMKDELAKLLKVALYGICASLFGGAFILVLGLTIALLLVEGGLALWGALATVAILFLMVATLMVGCGLAEYQIQSAEKWRTPQR